MDVTYLRFHFQKLVTQRNIFLFFSAVLCFIVVLLSFLLFSKEEKIIIVPTHAPSFWVQKSHASENYLENMGLFLADLLLNRSPADAEMKNKAILEHVHPAFFHEIRKQLALDAKQISGQIQSFVFQPEKTHANPADQTFLVEGDAFVFVGKQGSKPSCAQMLKRRYTLGFKSENYKLLLVSLKREEL